VSESGEHVLNAEADHSVLSRHGLRSKKFVLAVSSLNPSKNFRGLARAIDVLALRDFDIVVAGGTNPKIFRGERPLPAGVKYIGYVSDAELRALYESAGCFVFPSVYEGFGLPPLEAMCCGCPVIASRAASMPEICRDAAIYCDPLSPSDIAEKIALLMSSSALQNELSAKGRSLAAAYSWERSALALWRLATTGRVD
jgi:glycosyltransferase involved in cell wall biosynthesis